MILAFDPVKNVTSHLGRFSNLDSPILQCSKLRVFQIISRSAVAEASLRKPTLARGSCGFLCSSSWQER